MGGLLGSAVLAWALGWAKTYVLALVSERMGADLRSTTYEHLLRCRSNYFGGKRTGDLMSRIGSGRPHLRLPVAAPARLRHRRADDHHDRRDPVLDQPLAGLVTLVPLPFIAWMIHVVRDKLRTGFEKIDRVWGEVTNVLADTIPGIRVVKAFAQEKREASASAKRTSTTWPSTTS
jgi:ATP-binding cassette subfamily B protein